jgi:hypothetical protein
MQSPFPNSGLAMSARSFSIRIAKPTDSDGICALLAASYSSLLTGHYDSDLLAQALPHFTKANPTLLACGTYYVAEREPDILVGCGGWTPAKPARCHQNAVFLQAFLTALLRKPECRKASARLGRDKATAAAKAA